MRIFLIGFSAAFLVTSPGVLIRSIRRLWADEYHGVISFKLFDCGVIVMSFGALVLLAVALFLMK